jgi:hypothetical protein
MGGEKVVVKVESGRGCVVKIAVKAVAKEVIAVKHVSCECIGEGGKDGGKQGCGSGSRSA